MTIMCENQIFHIAHWQLECSKNIKHSNQKTRKNKQEGQNKLLTNLNVRQLTWNDPDMNLAIYSKKASSHIYQLEQQEVLAVV